ncbi:hypothetical protein PYCCODRAFT_1423697 [Trametes coccinea BRFM310]|uniref:Secreted protein n=1 Tax=Trametes coccinea (strain BRFM310) TaxID=1353009 RepID=A0A1Y2IVR6_TRAC3|nr:hypothetical protein PYCCODRAFT_1423697 [Trametes coccinea BRFM310]
MILTNIDPFLAWVLVASEALLTVVDAPRPRISLESCVSSVCAPGGDDNDNDNDDNDGVGTWTDRSGLAGWLAGSRPRKEFSDARGRGLRGQMQMGLPAGLSGSVGWLLLGARHEFSSVSREDPAAGGASAGAYWQGQHQQEAAGSCWDWE